MNDNNKEILVGLFLNIKIYQMYDNKNSRVFAIKIIQK